MSAMRDLTICRRCGADTVVPVDWDEAGNTFWWILMRCGSCGSWERGTFHDKIAEFYDDRLNEGADEIAEALRWLDRARFVREIDRFAQELALDVITPEDFR